MEEAAHLDSESKDHFEVRGRPLSTQLQGTQRLIYYESSSLCSLYNKLSPDSCYCYCYCAVCRIAPCRLAPCAYAFKCCKLYTSLSLRVQGLSLPSLLLLARGLLRFVRLEHGIEVLVLDVGGAALGGAGLRRIDEHHGRRRNHPAQLAHGVIRQRHRRACVWGGRRARALSASVHVQT